MTKLAWVATVLVVICIAGALLYFSVLARAVPVPDREDVWTPQNAVLLDSTQIKGAPTAYLFRYDIGSFGFSAKMVSIGTLGHEHAVIRSEYITGITWPSSDTLVVELSRAEYTIGEAPKGIVVVPKVVPAPRD